MKFARFWKYGFLSNWGSYSVQERGVLQKESDVAKLLQNNNWLCEVQKINPLVKKFLVIQTSNSVTTDEIPGLGIELDDMKKTFTDMVGKSPKFVNHQPDALVGEIRAHLASRTQARNNRIHPNTSKVISYKADLRNHRAENFHAMIATGQKALWVYDVDGYLSIGDPQGNKHSVVAAGKEVLGAGIAQKKSCQNTDMYLAMKDQLSRAVALDNEAALTSVLKDKQLYKENADSLRMQANDFKKALNGWTPPKNSERVIVLDFDSGHYAPRDAWQASTKAWNDAGYKVEWSSTSKFT